MRFHGKHMIGADPVLVVLRREQTRWKAFSVSSELLSIESLPELARLAFRPPATSAGRAPAAPQLLHPGDGGRHGEAGRSFAWEIPGDTPLAAQVCEVFLDDKESHWPLSRLKVFPGEPRTRALQSVRESRAGTRRRHGCPDALVRLGHRRRRQHFDVQGAELPADGVQVNLCKIHPCLPGPIARDIL